MIPRAVITAWALTHPWGTVEQVEQDLILSQAICLIASDSFLAEELVFRGGTAIAKTFSVESGWWSGQVEVPTFQMPELIATKLRALYQRSKGRDLFDLWLALSEAGVNPDTVLAAFAPYRPLGYTANTAIANLERKVADNRFRHDLDPLISTPLETYNVDQAAALVINSLLVRV
jgi:predicted nucleotidyltransferase component of viral defense system